MACLGAGSRRANAIARRSIIRYLSIIVVDDELRVKQARKNRSGQCIFEGAA
jgi:hypothetical protein